MREAAPCANTANTANAANAPICQSGQRWPTHRPEAGTDAPVGTARVML
jgi:hypothetical protein